MATTVGFASEKGGVGKTTICYHLAIALSRFHDKKVLVVDGDYQRGGITGRFAENLIEKFRTATVEEPTLYSKFLQLYGGRPVTPNIDVIDYLPTTYARAIATQTREWGGLLKWTERTEYRRIEKQGGIFETYVTEGDGLRRAAHDRCPVFDIGGRNADKQSRQLRGLTREFIRRCPAR